MAEEEVVAGLQWLGILLAVIACFISNLGVNLQKQSHTEIQDKLLSTGVEENYAKSWKWQLGMVILIVGSVCDFIALGFGRQCVIAPLGSLTLVSNVILSIPMHGVRPSKGVLYATCFIICGSAVAVVFGGDETAAGTVKDVFGLYRTAEFWIYTVCMGAIMFLFFMLLTYLDHCEEAGPEFYTDTHQRVHMFAYASLSGTMGAQNVLFAKSTALLLVLSCKKGSEGTMFFYFQTYLILACLVVTITLQLRWLNDALKRFSALFIVPIFQAFWIFVSVLGGLYVYQELKGIDGTGLFAFAFGVTITIGGVLYLSLHGENESHSQVQEANATIQTQEGHTSLLQAEIKNPGQMDSVAFFHHVSEIADAITWGPTSMARLASHKPLARVDENLKYRSDSSRNFGIKSEHQIIDSNFDLNALDIGSDEESTNNDLYFAPGSDVQTVHSYKTM